ncbi:MAG: replicative DNA helicase [Magnetococcales bacterium]|nr:replicative DNA helicase [Magnetococcales bacterium]
MEDPFSQFEQDDGQRRPAYSKEAEQSVLGAILLDNTILDQVADILTPEDFYLGAHRVTFRAMLTLFEKGQPADPVILREYLEKNEELEAVGGPGYLAELVNTVPATANAKAYANLVHDKSMLRELSREASAIVEEVYRSRGNADAILDEAEQRIFAVAERKEQRRSGYADMRSVVVPVLEHIENLMDHKTAITGIPTGFADLDRLLSGLQKTDLVIVAGRPAMGKTALAMNMAAHAALEAQVPVAVFSLEMSKEQLVTRLLASVGRVDAQGLRSGYLKDSEYKQLSQTAARLTDAPLYIDDSPALTVTALRAKARRLKRERDVGLIVVDYLQLMRGATQAENRTQEITQISQGLKAVAKELRVPVLAISQLSRAPEGRTGNRPMLSDLRESGSIEQDADVVMFVFREEYYKPDDPSLKGLAEVIVAKQRNGPVGSARLTFLHNITRFEDRSNRDEIPL